MEYAAIVIAAGLSSRMGEFKPLLDIGGKPALLRLLSAITSAGLSHITVVTGHGHEAIEAALAEDNGDGSIRGTDLLIDKSIKRSVPLIEPSPLSLVYNKNYKRGMFSSIQAGIKKATETDAALLFPVDVPLVAAETIRALIAAWEKGGASRFAVPSYRGKNGHPLLVPSAYFGAILDYTGEGGLKEIRNRYIAEMLRYETDDEGCVLDMDTPEDYEKLLAYEKRQDDRE